MFRKFKQKPQDAFEGQADDAIQKQLVACLLDGLYRDGMKLKVMRDNTDTLNAAVKTASREQNLQKRFQVRLNQSKHEHADSIVRVKYLWKLTMPEIKV